VKVKEALASVGVILRLSEYHSDLQLVGLAVQNYAGRIGNPTYNNTMKEFYRRHLPHWQPQGAVFFVTFRLKNSLPYEVVESLRAERERAKIALHKLPETERVERNKRDEQRYFERWEEYLDKAEFGPRWLSQPEIAEIVKEALHYRDGKVFDLHAFCIMSNHVHTVFEPLSKSERRSDLYGSDYQSDLQPLHKIMQSLKSRTARQANIILKREGAFWQDESYDRVIRDNDEYVRTVNYVLENPVKAGLVSQWDEWRWTYCKT
jgi:putative transposase